jgi:hypothetical protein
LFANRVTVLGEFSPKGPNAYFEQFLENYISIPHSLGYFISLLNFNLGKKWFGQHLGDFFTNSSGHPVFQRHQDGRRDED